jgi:hypothetical protein
MALCRFSRSLPGHGVSRFECDRDLLVGASDYGLVESPGKDDAKGQHSHSINAGSKLESA